MKTKFKFWSLGIWLSLNAAAFGAPSITGQPSNQSVSLGANITIVDVNQAVPGALEISLLA